MSGVCGSLKLKTAKDLKKDASTVGTLAELVLNNRAFKTSHTEDERKQVATLIAEAVDKLNGPSPVEAEAEVVDEPATRAKPTLKDMLHQYLDSKWFKALGLEKTSWKQKARDAVRENVRKYLEQSTGVTSTTDMYTGHYADRDRVENFLGVLKTNGPALVDSTIRLAREGEFDVRKKVVEAMKEAVVTVVPGLWLHVFDQVRHNRSYLTAQPRAARVRTRAV